MNFTSTSPPPSSTTATTFQGDTSSANLSLLSLSFAAASATPIPLSSSEAQQVSALSAGESFGASSSGFSNGHTSSPALNGSGLTNGVTKHHRRLSSTGKARRRLSDARDAAARPSPASAAALSMAALTLSSSPTPHGGVGEFSLPSKGSVPISTSFTSASNTLSGNTGVSVSPATSSIPIAVGAGVQDPSTGSGPTNGPPSAKPIAITGKNGKKRGIDHKCESCSKIYRHPSCLIKHRWEHTPHWRESSKYVLSKHQQVQLLEAAAILSHLSPDSATGTSLPEDRSLWPSFLSGGALPLPEGANPGISSSYSTNNTAINGVSASYVPTHPSSSSVPAPSVLRSTSTAGSESSMATPARAPSTGPRLHDYNVPSADVTQVRPGLLMMGGSRSGSGADSAASSAPTGEVIPTISTSTPISVPHEGSAIGYGHGHRVSSSYGSSSSPYYRAGTGTSGSVPSSSSYSSSTRTKLRSTSSASQGVGGGGGGAGYGYGRYTPSVTVSGSASSFAPSSSSYTSTSLSLPRSSLRSGSVFSESERSRSSSVEGEEDDEGGDGGDDGDGDEGLYNDHEFEDEDEVEEEGRDRGGGGGVDQDGDIDISGVERVNRNGNGNGSRGGYSFAGKPKGRMFDEYGYEYDRSVVDPHNAARKVGSNGSGGLNAMKEEQEDWEMEMDMD